jgi:hypothetical protein
MVRVEAARAGANGVRVLTMGHLAARLAGGFIHPIDPEVLHQTVRESLAASDLGELEAIKSLPGMARAVVATLDKVWRAGIELSTSSHPRLQALAALERNVLRQLPPSMKRPAELVELARSRMRHAPAVLGEVEIHGHSEMPLCWRPLLSSLAQVISVVWVAGSRSVPGWLVATGVEVRRASPTDIIPTLNSCATPQHEVLEAFRWMRALLAEGKATPEQIGIAAASPADFDDHVLAFSQDANIPLHFVHGIKAAATPHGQTAAALADILVNGISQERVRRLFWRLHGTPVLADLPEEWTRLLPTDAPLATVERWERVFAETEPNEWPEGTDRSGLATISFSRRDVEGRLLGRSPLIKDLKENYLNRSRTPEHAASESDRLLARPSEFGATAIARSGLGCWQDWYQAKITPHDGLVGRPHPRLRKTLGRTMSATSLRLLLRDPIRFTWRYALGWRQPEEADEPLTLDALAFGNLVHAVLQTAVSRLERDGGFGNATADAIGKAVEWAVGAVAGRWETAQPVPPPVIWRKALDAFAVRTLLGGSGDLGVETALLYPRAEQGEQAYFGMNELDRALDVLAKAIAIARMNLENGLALPGKDLRVCVSISADISWGFCVRLDDP